MRLRLILLLFASSIVMTPLLKADKKPKKYRMWYGGGGHAHMVSSQLNEPTSMHITAFTLGRRYQFPITSFANLMTGASLHFAGDRFENFNVEQGSTSADFELLHYRLGYLNIPAQMQIYKKVRHRTWAYASTGLSLNTLLFSNGKVAELTPCFVYTDTKFRRLNVGGMASLGLEMNYLLKRRMFVELRGMTDFSTMVAEGPVPFRNQSVQFVVGFGKRYK